MMKVYTIAPDTFTGRLIPFLSNGLDPFATRFRKKHDFFWKPPTLYTGPLGFVPVDCAAEALFGLFLSQHAQKILASELEASGELLPVSMGDLQYQWFNCTHKPAVVNHGAIEGLRETLPYIGESWKHVSKWALNAEQVSTATPIFSPDLQGLDRTLLCTDTFKDKVEAAELTGFVFEKIWSAEEGGIDISDPVLFPGGLAAQGKIYEERFAANAEKLGVIHIPRPDTADAQRSGIRTSE